MNIKELAKIAGVSVATISRVVNDKPGVREEERKRVKRIIEENDYRPNLIARGLVRKKSNFIGIVIPRFVGYYTDRVDAILEISKSQGYEAIISSSFGRFVGEIESIKTLIEQQVEGIIYFMARAKKENIEAIEKYSKTTPIVIVEQSVDELNIPTVLSDNYGGAKQAMNYLIQNGHKKIAYISGPYYDREGKKRQRAYEDMMQENGLNIEKGYIQEESYSIDAGKRAMKKIIEECDNMPTAVFSANDSMAIGAINYLRDNGINVPQDISVIGIDDIEFSEHFYPRLTTVRQDNRGMGEQAVKLLMEYISNRNAKSKTIILDQELVIRDSAKNIKEDIEENNNE